MASDTTAVAIVAVIIGVIVLLSGVLACCCATELRNDADTGESMIYLVQHLQLVSNDKLGSYFHAFTSRIDDHDVSDAIGLRGPLLFSNTIHSVAIHAISLHALTVQSISLYALSIHALAIHSIPVHTFAVYSVSVYNVAILAIPVHSVSIYPILRYSVSTDFLFGHPCSRHFIFVEHTWEVGRLSKAKSFGCIRLSLVRRSARDQQSINLYFDDFLSGIAPIYAPAILVSGHINPSSRVSLGLAFAREIINNP